MTRTHVARARAPRAPLAPLGPLVALAALASACPAADAPAEGEGEDGSAEACEHVVEGPAESATASAEEADAPVVGTAHTRSDVALVAVDGGNGGFVRYESAGGAVVAYLTSDIPIAFTAPDGGALSVDEQVLEDTCPEVVTSHHLVMPVGLVTIELGPTSAGDVSLVIEGENDPAEGA